MSEYFIIVGYKDHADGQAYSDVSCICTSIKSSFYMAIEFLSLNDHVCIFTHEYRDFIKNKPYTEVLPYSISIDIGHNVNVNKLLTLFKTP